VTIFRLSGWKVGGAALCTLAVVFGGMSVLSVPDPEPLVLPDAEPSICLPAFGEELFFALEQQHTLLIAPPPPETPAPPPAIPDRGERVSTVLQGIASWYGGSDGLDGLPTASGEIFNASDLTAAHRTLPFGTRVRVTFPRTGESVIVRINDRGPFIAGRIIDLSRAAAEAIGLLPYGIGLVELEVLQ
jgi:hypothetical protein